MAVDRLQGLTRRGQSRKGRLQPECLKEVIRRDRALISPRMSHQAEKAANAGRCFSTPAYNPGYPRLLFRKKGARTRG